MFLFYFLKTGLALTHAQGCQVVALAMSDLLIIHECTCTAHVHSRLTIVKFLIAEFIGIKYN